MYDVSNQLYILMLEHVFYGTAWLYGNLQKMT